MRTLLQVLIFSLCWLTAAQTVPSWFPKIPPLQQPSGEVIRVSTTDELLAAVDRLSAGGTVLLTDGQYQLSRPVVLDQKTNIVLRSASGDPTQVTLSGKGWEHGDEHDDILHIGNCEGVTIADLSFADCRSYGIKVEAEHAPKDIQILNCRFRNIGVRAIKGSAAQDARTRAVKGSVRGCYFENTKVPPADWLFGGDYIAAIDMMALEDWTFSHNVFWNIKGRNGGGRAAIFIWVRSSQVVVEQNLIVNCDRGVAFGNPGKSTANIAGERLVYVSDGIIRNNFIVGGPDCGIELWYADRIKVFNNTIWRPEQNWNRGIRIGTGTSDTEIANNLVHGAIQPEGGEAQVHHNLAGRLESYFEDPASGNLMLTSAATGAFGRGVPLSEVTEDIRGRPRTGNPDLGAWQSESVSLSRDEILDHIRGGWTGMLIGGIEGLAHEFKYIQQPRQELPDYPFLPQGARTDDDNDFEWTHLFFMEKEGVLKIPYPRLVEIWKANMNTGLWCANEQARKLMDKGIVPPRTADPSLNRFAPYNLAGQFCVESYGMIAPGMPQSAAELGLHYAKVSVSGEPLQAAQYWTTLISLASVSSEPLEELLKKSLLAVDPVSAQAEAVREGINAFHKHPTDWKAARQYFHDKWYVPKEKPWDAQARPLKWNDNSTPLNGAMVVLAVLYGQGDFYRTGQYAMALGYDADCNAATACAVVGTRIGFSAIEKLPQYHMPDHYQNLTRPELPRESKVSDQAALMVRLCEKLILANGGQAITINGKPGYRIELQSPRRLE